ncbi:epidermal growth factor receptor substrate 15 [Clonorchis sinensis]|uniref:Epidermal growth factor receptor substrate 15 n=1 Tax=Clonorchis sinensis TaxID=79923 RepID=G7YMF2_CLOSI|nr:epidermal growth factor receptor substrate 15 [Clonorchis sinensis]
MLGSAICSTFNTALLTTRFPVVQGFGATLPLFGLLGILARFKRKGVSSTYFHARMDIRFTRDQRGQLGLRGAFRFALVRFEALTVGVLGDNCAHNQRGYFRRSGARYWRFHSSSGCTVLAAFSDVDVSACGWFAGEKGAIATIGFGINLGSVGLAPTEMWTIPPDKIAKYEGLFDQLNPVDGRLDGTKCKALCRCLYLDKPLATVIVQAAWPYSPHVVNIKSVAAVEVKTMSTGTDRSGYVTQPMATLHQRYCPRCARPGNTSAHVQTRHPQLTILSCHIGRRVMSPYLLHTAGRKQGYNASTVIELTVPLLSSSFRLHTSDGAEAAATGYAGQSRTSGPLDTVLRTAIQLATCYLQSGIMAFNRNVDLKLVFEGLQSPGAQIVAGENLVDQEYADQCEVQGLLNRLITVMPSFSMHLPAYKCKVMLQSVQSLTIQGKALEILHTSVVALALTEICLRNAVGFEWRQRTSNELIIKRVFRCAAGFKYNCMNLMLVRRWSISVSTDVAVSNDGDHDAGSLDCQLSDRWGLHSSLSVNNKENKTAKSKRPFMLGAFNVRTAMLKSQLSTETLGRIWDMSDIDNDGNLDKEEFVLAFPSTALATTHFNPNTMSAWSQFGLSQPHSYPPWVVSEEELAKSNRVFATIDMDADGLVSGAEVREVLMRSGLQQSILAQIWNLVDIHGSGLLNCEQFAVAMHLATEQLASSPYSRTLPVVLPPALVPPSLRPIPPDPTLFEESNKLIAEIEAINRERAEVEAAYTAVSVDTQRRATETASMQRELDKLNHTSRTLATQRSEAERRLTDYAHEREMLSSKVEELKEYVALERKKAEAVRNEVNNQQVSAKNQEEAITRLRTELNDLIRRESSLQDQVAESRRRLELIEAEKLATQSRIEKATSKVNLLESTRGQLLQVLDQYTCLLNGDTSIMEPDEQKVKALLNGIGLDRTSAQITTRDEDIWPIDGSVYQRVMGASSVPLSLMVNSALGQQTYKSGGREQSISSLGIPLNTDPFLGTDPFNPPGNSKPHLAGKETKDDFFGPGSLFTPDPFKDLDPFGGDPFSLPVTLSSSITHFSAFDPFTNCVNGSNVPRASFTGVDFDAVFGAPNADSSPTDPFGADPFSCLEQVATAQTDTIGHKKSPPPRPTTQPGAPTGNRESKPNEYPKTSVASLPDFNYSSHALKSTSPPPFRSIGNNSSSTLPHKSSLLSRVRSGNKSKKDIDLAVSKSARAVSKSSGPKTEDGSGWAPSGLSEAEQLTLATLESQRLAQLEERARQQEQADLELAIRLSQMDTTTSS